MVTLTRETSTLPLQPMARTLLTNREKSSPLGFPATNSKLATTQAIKRRVSTLFPQLISTRLCTIRLSNQRRSWNQSTSSRRLRLVPHNLRGNYKITCICLPMPKAIPTTKTSMFLLTNQSPFRHPRGTTSFTPSKYLRLSLESITITLHLRGLRS